jgi:hypothetical protein
LRGGGLFLPKDNPTKDNLMARIINHSAQALSILGNEFSGFVKPRDPKTGTPGTLEVPDDVATAWASKPTPRALIINRLVSIEEGEATAAPAAAATEPVPVKVEEPVAVSSSSDAPAAAPARVHWRKAIKAAQAMDDLDALTELHVNETRPRVLEAIEARMAELQGG